MSFVRTTCSTKVKPKKLVRGSISKRSECESTGWSFRNHASALSPPDRGGERTAGVRRQTQRLRSSRHGTNRATERIDRSRPVAGQFVFPRWLYTAGTRRL